MKRLHTRLTARQRRYLGRHTLYAMRLRMTPMRCAVCVGWVDWAGWLRVDKFSAN